VCGAFSHRVAGRCIAEVPDAAPTPLGAGAVSAYTWWVPA
jgi:hypothetical protein